MSMLFKGFRIYAIPRICDAYCKCGARLKEVSNGPISSAMYCQKCENVFALKLVKVPKSRLSDEFLRQCREEAKDQS